MLQIFPLNYFYHSLISIFMIGSFLTVLPAQAMQCTKIFMSDSTLDIKRTKGGNTLHESAQVLPELENIRARLRPDIARQFDFTLMDPPTAAQAQKMDSGLTALFLKSISQAAFEDDGVSVFPLKGPKSSQFVRVYRVVSISESLQNFDISHNYKHGNALYNWRGDFVTHEPRWTWAYASGKGNDVLVEYLIPAKLLEIDLTTRKVQEPYYVISKEKMNAAGIQNVGVFANRIAIVAAFERKDPTWSYDPRFDSGPSIIREEPKSLSDPKIHWVDDKSLQQFIDRGF